MHGFKWYIVFLYGRLLSVLRVIGAAHVEDLNELPNGELLALQLGRSLLLWIPSDADCSNKSQSHRLLEIIKAVLSEKQL